MTCDIEDHFESGAMQGNKIQPFQVDKVLIFVGFYFLTKNIFNDLQGENDTVSLSDSHILKKKKIILLSDNEQELNARK